jgi:hypothetical protein
MDELRRVAAARALAAGALAFARAEQKLSQPEGEALLADPATPRDEQASRKSGAGSTLRKPTAQRVVTEQRDEGHAWNIERARAPR